MKSPLIIGFLLTLIFLSSCGEDSDNAPKQELGKGTVSEFLDQHNFYRSAVGVADIEWSDDLAKSAQDWADELGKNCDFKHSNSGFGENLWKGTAGAFSIKQVVDSWGSEKADYDYDSNTCSDVCGHYTQVVWANTAKVGCGVVICDGFDVWVCQYDPPGNFVGQKPY